MAPSTPLHLEKRYCSDYDAAHGYCGGGWWYSDKGYVAKWAILGALFGFFFLWFVGGYLHAKSRLKKGKPLLAYHRWLVSRQTRSRYGQAPPQNHFTFYNMQRRPYPPPNQPYVPRTDGAYPEPPPVYTGNDAPPSYYAPPPQGAPGVPKPYGQQPPVYATGPQQTGVVTGESSGVGASGSANVNGEGQAQGQGQPADLPPRPQQAFSNFMGRFRR